MSLRVSRWQRCATRVSVTAAAAMSVSSSTALLWCSGGSAATQARRCVCTAQTHVASYVRARRSSPHDTHARITSSVAGALCVSCRTQATSAATAAAAAVASDSAQVQTDATATRADAEATPTTAAAAAPAAAAAATDKRFHCSVCKKSFRLELAAKLHIKQAHNDNGSVEAGAGPGQVGSATTSTTGAAATAGAAALDAATATSTTATRAGTVVDGHTGTERRLPRHLRPAPKPLHSPDRDVAAAVMDEMLAVWDKVGVSRLGGTFVHSSMVMKVFAARPGEPVHVPHSNVYSGSTTLTPAAAAAVHSRYGAATAATTTSTGATAQSPYGQLPMFGQPSLAQQQQQQQQQQRAQAETATATTTTPFVSPFANPALFTGTASAAATAGAAPSATSPFAQAVTADAGNAPASTTTAAAAPSSPFAPTPVASSNGSSSFPASPFLSETGVPLCAGAVVGNTTTTAATAAGYAFAQGGAADATAAAAAMTSADTRDGGDMAAAATTTTTRHVCKECGRDFATYRALRMHSKSKHDIKLPLQLDAAANRNNGGGDSQDVLSALPVYVPSPVDLSLTSPFGTREVAASWTSIEVVLSTHTMSNITLVGTVLEVEDVAACTRDNNSDNDNDNDSDDSDDSGAATLVTLLVTDDGSSGRTTGEALTLRCVGASRALVQQHHVTRGDVVFACGTLRMLPMVDAHTQVAHTTPLIVVAPPMGMLAKVREMDVPLVNVAEALQKLCTFLRAAPAGDAAATAASRKCARGSKSDRNSAADDDDADVAQLFAPPPAAADGDAVVDVDVELAFLASPESHRVPLYVRVPHAVMHGSVCLITPPPQRAFKDKVQALVEAGDAAAARVRRVMDAHKFDAKVREPVAVRAFARSYDDVVVYALRKYPTQLCGEFLGHHRLPVWLAKRGDFAAVLHDAMRTVPVSRRGQNAVACRIGHTGLSIAQLEENVRTFVHTFTQHPQGTKLAHVLHIRVAGTNGKGQRAGLPVFAHVFHFPAVATPAATHDDKPDEQQPQEQSDAQTATAHDESPSSDVAAAATTATPDTTTTPRAAKARRGKKATAAATHS